MRSWYEREKHISTCSNDTNCDLNYFFNNNKMVIIIIIIIIITIIIIIILTFKGQIFLAIYFF